MEEIGETLVYLNNSCRIGECNLGNLITDSFIDHVSNIQWRRVHVITVRQAYTLQHPSQLALLYNEG